MEERAAQGQGDGERQPCAEQADGVHGDQGEVAGAEPVDQPDGVAAGVEGEEAAETSHDVPRASICRICKSVVRAASTP
jgi:hypothetical protein